MTSTVGHGEPTGVEPAPGEAPVDAHAPGRWARSWWRDHRVQQWAVVVAPVVVVVWMAWDRRWMADDGFIHLRVVDQVVHGNGPVFNAGERVETSTSPLWMALLTVLSFVTSVGLPWKAVAAGLLLTVVGMVAAARASVVLSRASGDTGIVWPLGLTAVAALPPLWDFATSGLETGLAFGWIGLSCWWVATRATATRPPSRRAEVGGAVLVSLGYTIRPDLGVFVLVLGGVLLAACRRTGRRRRAAVLGGLVAVPLANQVFRMGYYALLVPNTAVAKEASSAQWGSGWRYLTDLIVPYALWLPIAAALVVVGLQVARDRERGRGLVAAARTAPALAAVVHGLYIMRVGGDFMHARLLLPAVFALLAPVGISFEGLRAGGTDRWPRRVAVASATWVVLATFLLRPTYVGLFTTHPTVEDERRAYQEFTGMEHPVRSDYHTVRIERRAGAGPEDGRVVAVAVDDDLERVEVRLRTDLPASAAGVFRQPAYAWDTDVYMLDIGGLAHPVGSHLDELSGGRMGHQKLLGLAWQLAGLTDVERVRSESGGLLATRDELHAASRARTCGQLGDYLAGIREPLTPARFLDNVVDSFANTLLRIPRDPREAEAELCGG